MCAEAHLDNAIKWITNFLDEHRLHAVAAQEVVDDAKLTALATQNLVHCEKNFSILLKQLRRCNMTR